MHALGDVMSGLYLHRRFSMLSAGEQPGIGATVALAPTHCGRLWSVVYFLR